MGMPISNYTVLKALGYGGAAYEVKIARNVLSPFNLFAFIIHDPETHENFDRVINERFDFLDYLTGHKLLFLALVDPPSEWLLHASHRRYYRELNAWQSRELLNRDNVVISAEKGITAFSLAHYLNIPSEMLPCLVITSDFQANEFVWFKTCPNHVEEQLKRLGYIADRTEESSSRRRRSPLEIIHREELDLCEGAGTESLETNLARSLTDVLSFIIAGNDRDSWLRRQALEQVQNRLSELHRSLSILKNNYDESHSEDFETLAVNIALFVSQLGQGKQLETADFVRIEKYLLENDSYQLLKTAHRVLNLLSSKTYSPDLRRLEDLPDYTPVVICLAKVFEKEINLSVVHWIRALAGINLPPFFNKYQPHVRARFPSHAGREIDFNMERRGKWLPPGLGQSENVSKQLAKTEKPEELEEENWKLLIDCWGLIREKRNAAAHVEVVDQQAVSHVRNALRALSRHRVFNNLYEMKTRYSGRRRSYVTT